MPMLSISSPTRASLWQGRVYTAAVFALALAGAILTVLDAPGAGAAFIAATGLYIAGSTVLWLRGDYILRMFGCGWPIVLAKADEMQKAQRQRAFSFTFLAFLSVFSLGLGLHIGVMVGQHLDGDPVTGLGGTDPIGSLAFILTLFFTLTLLPQAYLAWTLRPYDDEDDTVTEAAA
ncbi:MAG: hypothetical protein ACOC20_07655 [Oceanicaulis sp.]